MSKTILANKSGITPVGVSVLVKPDEVLQETESGIIMHSNAHQDREEMGQTDGIVIAIAEGAYYDEKVPRCILGDRIIMAKYAGMVRKGNDGLTYRLIKDNDVIGLLEKE